MPFVDPPSSRSATNTPAHRASWPPAPSTTPGLLQVVPLLLTAACKLPPAQRLLLLALANHGGPNSRGIFPSLRRLTEVTGFGRRTIQGHLRNLQQRGVLRLHETRNRSHHYELLLESLQAPQENAPETESTPPPAHASPPRTFTLAEMQATLAFIAEAGSSTELELVPELCPAPPGAASPFRAAPPSPATAAGQATVAPPQPAAEEQELHPPVPMVHPGAQLLTEGDAAAAPELSQENSPTQHTYERGERRAGATPPPVDNFSSDRLPHADDVRALWAEAWAARYRASYTPERSDQALCAFLAWTAQGKALERQDVLLTCDKPSPGPGMLARQFLQHVFEAFLERPGHGDFLREKKHPLRYLEQDLQLLGSPWISPKAPRAIPPSPPEFRPRKPKVIFLTPPPRAPDPVAQDALQGRPCPPLASTSDHPRRSTEEILAALGPQASAEEVAAFAQAEQRRLEHQQHKAAARRRNSGRSGYA